MWELSVELYILHEGTYIRVSTISVPTVLQVAFQRFLRFRKFRLVISSARGVMLNHLHIASILWDIGKQC